MILGGRFPLSIEGSRFDNMEGGVEPGVGPDYVLSGATEPDRENQKTLVQGSIRLTIQNLLEQGHIVVLVYPIPEVGWQFPEEIERRAILQNPEEVVRRARVLNEAVDARGEIFSKIRKRILPQLNSWPLNSPVTTSYEVYVDRTQSSFDALDSVTSDHIIRIYPHKIFCDEREGGRCVTHDDNTIFYFDDNHLSSAGALLVTGEIMKEISHWDPQP